MAVMRNSQEALLTIVEVSMPLTETAKRALIPCIL